ncbi:MAG: uncharacterized protein A8A55_1515 [Amphiamblys sp. WSBS2006]|nr:MAG: uncharacterized protein A8A55_1515 [Amphiamblys sp. WSBS2006]
MDTKVFTTEPFDTVDALERAIHDDSFENIEKGGALIAQTLARNISEVSRYIYTRSEEISTICSELVTLEKEIRCFRETEKTLLLLKEKIFRGYDMVLGNTTADKKELPAVFLEKEEARNRITQETAMVLSFDAELEGHSVAVHLLTDMFAVANTGTGDLVLCCGLESITMCVEERKARVLFGAQIYTLMTGSTSAAMELKRETEKARKALRGRRKEKKEKAFQEVRREMLSIQNEVFEKIFLSEYEKALDGYTEMKRVGERYETETGDRTGVRDVVDETRRRLCLFLQSEMAREYISLAGLKRCESILGELEPEALPRYLEGRAEKLGRLRGAVAVSRSDFVRQTMQGFRVFLEKTLECVSGVFGTKSKDTVGCVSSWVFSQTERMSWQMRAVFDGLSFSLEDRCSGYKSFCSGVSVATRSGLRVCDTFVVAAIEEEIGERCAEVYAAIKEIPEKENRLELLSTQLGELEEYLDCVGECGLVELVCGKIVVGVSIYVGCLRRKAETESVGELVSVLKDSSGVAQRLMPETEERFKGRYKKNARLFRNVKRKSKEIFGLAADRLDAVLVGETAPKEFPYATDFVFSDGQEVSPWVSFFVGVIDKQTGVFSCEKTKIVSAVLFSLFEHTDRVFVSKEFTHSGMSQMILDVHYLALVCSFALTKKNNEQINQFLAAKIRGFLVHQSEVPVFKSAEWFDQRAREIAAESVCFQSERVRQD